MPGRPGNPGPTRGSRPWAARRQYRPVRAEIQRRHQGHEGHDGARGHHGLLRSHLRIRHEEPAGRHPDQAGGRYSLRKEKGWRAYSRRGKDQESGKYKTVKISKTQVNEIAKKKIQDLNAGDLDHAARIIEGTARSLGITVEG